MQKTSQLKICLGISSIPKLSKRIIVSASLVMALIFSLAAWALASPVGADPDGQFHLSSIWCGSGYARERCEPPSNASESKIPMVVKVPSGVALAGTCNSARSTESASCTVALLNDHAMIETKFNNQGRLYPNLYYFVANKLVGHDIARSALSIRILNILLFIFLVSFIWILAPPDIRDGIGLTLVTFLVPLGVFIIASNNGSSWTTSGVSVYWAFLVIFLTSPDKARWMAAGLLSLLSAAMAAGSRADGAIFIVFSTAIAVLLAIGRDRNSVRKYWYRICAPFVISLMAVIAYFSAGQHAALTSGLLGSNDIGRNPAEVFFSNFQRLPVLYMGAFGLRGGMGDLGWLDTPMPEIVTASVLFTVIGLIVYSLKKRSRSEQLALYVSFIFLIVTPMAMLQMDNSIVGENVQARYILPLLVMTFGILLSGFRSQNEEFLSTKLRAIFSTLMIVAYTFALHTTMRRYITGNDVINWNLDRNREWWWSRGPAPMVVLCIGSLCFAYVVIYVMWKVDRKSRPKSVN
jgi:hypothetical protein